MSLINDAKEKALFEDIISIAHIYDIVNTPNLPFLSLTIVGIYIICNILLTNELQLPVFDTLPLAVSFR